MLKNKCIVIGVTGSIAVYKIASLVSMLKKQNADIHVIMTKNATEFITPLTFEVLSQNKCIIDTFEKNRFCDIEHISIAKRADLILIAPATANIIAKMANGIADDFLTTTVLAANCKKIVAPTMNTQMLNNNITQDNISKLKKYGFLIIKPAYGLLACNDTGFGKLEEPDVLFEYILQNVQIKKPLDGKNVLITAGATCEYLDPVRFLTNPSTGKMGFALAKACSLKGANVTIVCGKTTAKVPMFTNIINVISAKEMFEQVKKIYKNFDIIFKAAAVSDFTPKQVFKHKVKKDTKDNIIELENTDDILSFLGKNKKTTQVVCGFSMETNDLIENSTKKLIKKNVDLIVANSLNDKDAGFEKDTNVVTIIKSSLEKIELKKMSKFDIANIIIDHSIDLLNQKLKSNLKD